MDNLSVLAGVLEDERGGGDNMTAEVCSAEAPLHETVDVDLAVASSSGPPRDAISMVERVAKVVSGCSVIGEARNALSAAGWTATIAANRITVDDDVLAQFIPAKIGSFGVVSARWVIYSAARTHPVWIVGAEPSVGAVAQ
jgi:hypothetical protein